MSERRVISASRLVLGVALAVLIVGVTTALLLTRVVPLTGRQTLVIVGWSMEPSVPSGSAVVITPVQPADLRVGDVVSLRSGPEQAVFTHRITRFVEVDGQLFMQAQGDANRDVDPSLVPFVAVLGRVDWSFPAVGLLVAYLDLPAGKLFAIFLGLTLIVSLRLLDKLAAVAAEEDRFSHRLPPSVVTHQPDRGGVGAADG